MTEVHGKYGIAKIYNSTVEPTAYSQIMNLMNQPMVEDANVRIMPDVHAGAGCVIGYTLRPQSEATAHGRQSPLPAHPPEEASS